jgi:hypothetical protein
MNDKPVAYRSVVETASAATIGILFVAVVFMLVIGIVGTFLINTSTLSTLVAGIILLVALTFAVIFRQVVMQVTAEEVALCCGTETVWISREDISSVEPLEMTFGRRVAALVSLGPWSAAGREKIHYFGTKSPLVLISTKDGSRFAASVENADEAISEIGV